MGMVIVSKLRPLARIGLLLLVLPVAVWTEFQARNNDRYSYLDNGRIRVGVDRERGGAIDYLAESPLPNHNYVNRYDTGRLIQKAFYGPPFIYRWADLSWNWPWNPVQGGDWFDNGSGAIELTNDGSRIYTKSQPYLWGAYKVRGECLIETWIQLENRAVKIESKFSNGPEDHSRWSHQELLAVYVNTELSNLWYYGGDRPFSGGPLTSLHPGVSNVVYCPTEYWSAWTDDRGFGLGVYSFFQVFHTVGRSGTQGLADDYAPDTNYAGINPRYSISPHAVSRETAYIVLDRLENIRTFAGEKSKECQAEEHWLTWGFNEDQNREGWSGGWDGQNGQNTIDDGYGVTNGTWAFRTLAGHPLFPTIVSPQFLVSAQDFLGIEMSLAIWAKGALNPKIIWNRLNDPAFIFPAANSKSFALIADGRIHTYTLRLKGSSTWKGFIRQLALAGLGQDTRVELDSFRLVTRAEFEKDFYNKDEKDQR